MQPIALCQCDRFPQKGDKPRTQMTKHFHPNELHYTHIHAGERSLSYYIMLPARKKTSIFPHLHLLESWWERQVVISQVQGFLFNNVQSFIVDSLTCLSSRVAPTTPSQSSWRLSVFVYWDPLNLPQYLSLVPRIPPLEIRSFGFGRYFNPWGSY